MDTMKALAIEQRPKVGGLSKALRMMELPVPQPGPGEVRVRVEASGINVDDQHFAEGTMFGGVPVAPTPTPKHPWVPGTDLAGTIDALGPNVTGRELGQRVFGLRSPRLAGPWAELAIARADHVALTPDGWTPTEAGAACLSSMVVCSIIDALGDPAGKLCLVVGASGSIGTMLVPTLARAGARVWGVCSARNRSLVEGLGAERVIDYQQAPWAEQVEAARERPHAVIDLVGGSDTARQGRATARPDGSFITVVGPEKHVGERKLGVLGLLAMFGRIGGSWLGSRLSGPKYHFVGPIAPDFAAIEQRVVSRGVRPTLDRVVSFDEAAVREALDYVASHRARGRVVIALKPRAG